MWALLHLPLDPVLLDLSRELHVHNPRVDLIHFVLVDGHVAALPAEEQDWRWASPQNRAIELEVDISAAVLRTTDGQGPTLQKVFEVLPAAPLAGLVPLEIV